MEGAYNKLKLVSVLITLIIGVLAISLYYNQPNSPLNGHSIEQCDNCTDEADYQINKGDINNDLSGKSVDNGILLMSIIILTLILVLLWSVYFLRSMFENYAQENAEKKEKIKKNKKKRSKK